MSFQEIKNNCDAETINGYPPTIRSAPNSIPVAGQNESATRKIHGSVANLNSTDIVDLPRSLATNYTCPFIYDYSAGNFVFSEPDLTSFSTNGYATITTSPVASLVIQWGFSSKSTEGSVSVTFPISFSSAPYSVICTVSATYWDTSALGASQVYGTPTTSGFTWYLQSIDGLTNVNGCYWVAIGLV